MNIRSILYRVAAFLGDVQAVRNNTVGRRIARRAAGRIAGKLLGRIFK